MSKFHFEFGVDGCYNVSTEGKDLSAAYRDACWELDTMLSGHFPLSNVDVRLFTVYDSDSGECLYDYGVCSNDLVEEVLG